MHKNFNEAALFSSYIVGSLSSPELYARYDTIVHLSAPSELSRRDTAILSFIRSHPKSLAAIDAYCALFAPQSEIRRRLYIMFAVLEATPEYSDKFLPKAVKGAYLLYIVGIALRAVFRVLSGTVIMLYIGQRK